MPNGRRPEGAASRLARITALLFLCLGAAGAGAEGTASLELFRAGIEADDAFELELDRARIQRANTEYVDAIRTLGVVVPNAAAIGNPLTEMAACIAEGHHERWDGKGYPWGLEGEEIPIEARITSLADVYDALWSKRPYKDPLPEDQVEAILERGNGTQFDPAIYDAYTKSREAFRDIRQEFEDERLEELHPDVASTISDLEKAA